MPEKKPRPVLVFPEIETISSEILVTRNRVLEPYFHLFSVSPENITQKPLGQIMGVFSVSDFSESSAYIGNAIASVAKKEYFLNPRRGAIESLEATLHRVNLALAELVKDGQTKWMGNLHGAIAIIEKSNIHFSVTGNGAVLLYRDGTLSDIGEGLASEESSTHPIKTFVEISSGRLLAGDCVLLVSPEVFSLFSMKELGQNARHLVAEEKFAQFLETAMMNDLQAGSALVLSISERSIIESETEQKQIRAPKTRTGKNANFFSDATFREAEIERARIFLDDDPTKRSPSEKKLAQAETEEVSKSRSGEIYVDGEAPPEKDEHPFITGLRWRTEDFLSSFRASASHTLRDFGTGASRTLSEFIRSGAHAVSKSVRKSLTRATRTITRQVHSERPSDPTPNRPGSDGAKPESVVPSRSDRSSVTRMPTGPDSATRRFSRSERMSTAITDTTETTASDEKPGITVSSVLKKSAADMMPFLLLLVEKSRIVLLFMIRRTTAAVTWIWQRFLGLSKKRQLIVACAVAFCLTLSGIGLWKGMGGGQEPEPSPVIVAEIPAPAFPPVEERDAVLVDVRTISEVPTGIVTPVFLNDSRYLATGTGIFDLSTQKSFTLPSDSPVILASGMNDLGLVFLVTRSGDVFSFSPPNGSFTKNAITLPPGSHPAGIGTFLTYLYLLESGSGKIYRFPRADGGFGENVLWTKSTPDPSIDAIAVSENIYGRNSTGVVSYFRGKPTEGFSFEKPGTSELTVTSICANQDAPDSFAVLDAPAKRIILYDRNGLLIKQFFNESFVDMTACALGADGIQAIVSSPSNAVTLSLSR